MFSAPDRSGDFIALSAAVRTAITAAFISFYCPRGEQREAGCWQTKSGGKGGEESGYREEEEGDNDGMEETPTGKEQELFRT